MEHIQFEIPISLANQPETIEYINASISILNDWSEQFNLLITEQKELLSHKKELTIYQHVKLISISENYQTQQKRYLRDCEVMQEKSRIIQQNLNSEEKIAIHQFIDVVANHQAQVKKQAYFILPMSISEK